MTDSMKEENEMKVRVTIAAALAAQKCAYKKRRKENAKK